MIDLKQVDIIMVNFNSTDSAIESIKSFERVTNKLKFNIVVVDNASEDDPGRLSLFPHVSCLFNTTNVGYSRAINHALKLGQSPYVIIINPDTLILNGFIDGVIQFLQANKDVGVVGPKILDADGSLQGSARRFPSVWTSLFGRRSPLTKIFPNNSITQREFPCFKNDGEDFLNVDWVSGACMVIRRNVLEAVGGFDTRFFLYWEDTDVCRRIKEKGYRIVYYRQAMVRHIVGKSSSTRPIRSICHFHISSFKLFQKYSIGIKSSLAPVVLIGLMIRCLFVISLRILFQTFQSKSDQNVTPQTNICKKIKILHIVPQISNAAHSAHVILLTKYLDGSKYISKLVTDVESKNELRDDILSKKAILIPQLRCGLSATSNLTAFLKIVKILLKEKPHIVHTYLLKAGIIGRFAALTYNSISLKKIKLVHSYHNHSIEALSMHRRLLERLIEKIFNRFTDAFVTVSQAQQWELTEKYSVVAPEKVFTVRSGIDFKMFSKNSTQLKGKLRTRLGVDSKTILIGSVGKLSRIKNQKMLLDAAKQLISSNNNKDIKFIFVGNGELRNFLERYSTQLGIESYVIFHGWEKDISSVYADLDVLAITSLREDIPLPIIEAMASNVPVITTGVGGVKELLGSIYDTEISPNGFKVCERGLLCPKNDVQSFVNGLNYLLLNGKQDRIMELDKARNFALTNYSNKVFLSETEYIYNQLLQ